MKLRNLCTLAAFVLVLSGCASLGIEKPTGLRQQIIAAEGQHNAVIDATDSALNAGTISSVTAMSIAAQADNAQLGLEAAKSAIIAGDVAGAQSKLAIALTTLTALQDYLRAQGAKP